MQINPSLEDTLIETKDHHQATNFQTILKLIQMALGSAIFAIPYAFSQAGLYWGILIQLLVFATQFKSWCTLLTCLGENNKCTIHEYLEINYGATNPISILAQLMAALINFGDGVIYVILFSTTLEGYFNNTFISKIIIFAILFTLLFGASFAKNLQIFSPIVKASLILIYMLFAYLSTLAIVEYDEWKLVKPDAHKIMMAFGIFMFGYDANGVLTEIRSEMKNIKDFKKCLFIAMVSETILFFIFGISSSLLFQEDTDQSIIKNFQTEFDDNKTILISLSVLMVAFVSTLIISAMMVNLPIYTIISGVDSEIIKICLKILYVLCQLLTAFLYPNFAVILSIIGCVCCVTLGFIIPYGMTFRFKVSKPNILFNTFIVLFGIVGGVFGVIACF